LWAKEFDRCKYDIYAVLGLKGKDITWGKPAKNSPIDLQTFSLDRVSDVRMIVDERTVDLDRLPDRGKSIAIQFNFKDSANPISIPFTEISLAGEWTQLLQEEIGARG
jgi:hypothetical protein